MTKTKVCSTDFRPSTASADSEPPPTLAVSTEPVIFPELKSFSCVAIDPAAATTDSNSVKLKSFAGIVLDDMVSFVSVELHEGHKCV